MRRPRRSRGKPCTLRRIKCQLGTTISPTTPLPCSASTKHGRSSTRRRRENWMIYVSTHALYALAFLGSGLRRDGGTATVVCGQARYENFGLALASDTEAYGGHLRQGAGTDQAGCGLRHHRPTTRKVGQYGRRMPLCNKQLTAMLQKPGRSAAEALKLAPTSQGAESRSRACVCHGGRYGTSRGSGPRLREALSAGHADAVALAACDSGAIGA